MGQVFKAENVMIGKRVALKVLHPQYVDQKEPLLRFVQEARTAAKLDHPGIVEIFDFGWTENSSPYIVMELLKGLSLDRVLTENKRMDVDEAINITSQLLSVLIAVHNKNIIHRDLKPENIFVCPNRRGEQLVKVLDFGISKARKVKQADRLTDSGIILGTPYYMSPEQARGAQDIDHRVDLWSTGVILYQMLSGRLVFEGQSYNEVLAKILSYNYLSIQGLRPDVPDWLDSILGKAMAPDRNERYKSAGAFLGDIKASLPHSTSIKFATPSSDQTDLLYGNTFVPPEASASAKPVDQQADTIEFDSDGHVLPKINVVSYTAKRNQKINRTIFLVAAFVVALGVLTGILFVTLTNNNDAQTIHTSIAPDQAHLKNPGTTETQEEQALVQPKAPEQSPAEQDSPENEAVSDPPNLSKELATRILGPLEPKMQNCLRAIKTRKIQLGLGINRQGLANIQTSSPKLSNHLLQCLEKALSPAQFPASDATSRSVVYTLHNRRKSRPRGSSPKASQNQNNTKSQPERKSGKRPRKRNPFAL